MRFVWWCVCAAGVEQRALTQWYSDHVELEAGTDFTENDRAYEHNVVTYVRPICSVIVQVSAVCYMRAAKLASFDSTCDV